MASLDAAASKPRQAITSPLEHRRFLSSESKAALVRFVLRLNKSCAGKDLPRDDDVSSSPCCARLVAMLRKVRVKVDAVPAANARDRRFGDAAFRVLHDWLRRESRRFAADVVAADDDQAEELAAYLAASFGDAQRLDYGTGHETAFVVFLLCLWRRGALSDSDVDSGTLVLTVIHEYLLTCRRIQLEYVLEPAGSRGVWALDDYQCLAFLFGSAQHCSAPASEGPAAAAYAKGRDLDMDVLALHEPRSLYFQALRFAKTSKRGAPFAEACPVLFAYAAKPWKAINRAVFLYYDSDVLGTFVVARHLLFGHLFPPEWLFSQQGTTTTTTTTRQQQRRQRRDDDDDIDEESPGAIAAGAGERQCRRRDDPTSSSSS